MKYGIFNTLNLLIIIKIRHHKISSINFYRPQNPSCQKAVLFCQPAKKYNQLIIKYLSRIYQKQQTKIQRIVLKQYFYK